MKVSIVIGVYNGADTLEATVRSILSQTLTDFELIIVNDGSGRETTDLIHQLRLQDSRIVVISNEKNEGLTRSLIAGCKAAQGEYIARLDNGDLMVPHERLQLQVEALEADPDLVLVGGGMDIVDLVNGDLYRSRSFPLEDQEIRHKIRNHSVYSHVTVMFRKSAYEQCEGYNAACYTGQDTELWPRMLVLGKGKILNEVFAVAPMNVNSISVKGNNRQIWAAIGREWQKIRTGGSIWRIGAIALYLVKLLIPVKQRIRLRYKKNYRHMGKYPAHNSSLTELTERLQHSPRTRAESAASANEH